MRASITTTAAIFAFFVLYAPQPLLPVFANDYGISVAVAGALMTATVTTLPLPYVFYKDCCYLLL